MNGPDDNAKRFVLQPGSFILKGQLPFDLSIRIDAVEELEKSICHLLGCLQSCIVADAIETLIHSIKKGLSSISLLVSMLQSSLHRIGSQKIGRVLSTAFDILFANERARLVGFCAHLTGNPGTAEDLAQETLLPFLPMNPFFVYPGMHFPLERRNVFDQGHKIASKCPSEILNSADKDI